MIGPNAAPRARRSPFGRPLPRDFYNRATEVVARELLGAVLEHHTGDTIVAGRIVEVEAYLGPHDPACHAAAGLTPRNHHLHGPPGTIYVYHIYGMHWCLNAVTREAGHGSAVLIRALEPLAGLALMHERRGRTLPTVALANGPGKLCQALGIDRSLDGGRFDAGVLRIRRGTSVDDADVVVSPRIGITRAAGWPLRFAVRDNACVSRPPRRWTTWALASAPPLPAEALAAPGGWEKADEPPARRVARGRSGGARR